MSVWGEPQVNNNQNAANEVYARKIKEYNLTYLLMCQ